MENARALEARGINTVIPYTVDENGALTDQAPGFAGRRVINDKGEKGDANEAVIKALIEAGMLLARGRLKHQYPHSWRSKKPVIFRNTPQWFIAMDKPIADTSPPPRGEGANTHPGDTLRARALHAISVTQWVPPSGQNRINGMIDSKPDWVISRQRAWGVPIAVFVREKGDGSAEILQDEAVNRAHRRRLRAGGRRRLVHGRRPGTVSRAARQRGMEEGRRHLRRLVRFRLDPRFRAGGSGAFSGTGRHQAQGRRRRRYRDVSGGLGPAPRLVPVLAAGKLRHPRPRAVRHRADARFHARRERPQDVEIDRQYGRAAEGDRPVRRRYPAALGLRVGLCRRPAHRPGNPQKHHRDLPQAAQFGPLDAGHAAPFQAGRRGRLRRDARTGTADAA